MNNNDSVFSGSIPELYDTYLVPMIFEAYAADLADRVMALEPQTVLETAAGSGVVTRALAPRLGETVRYTVTDLNQAMLDHAEARQGPDARILWRQADALNLPFDDATFDVVLCQFGAMFFPDKVAGYSEARRVLKPGGQFLFSVWDQISANEFADTVTQAAAMVFPDDPPVFMARTPHGYHDLSTIRQDLAGAKFSEISVSTLTRTSSAPSARHVAMAYCQGTPMRNDIEARDASRLDKVTDKATECLVERFGDGPVTSKIQAYIISAAV